MVVSSRRSQGGHEPDQHGQGTFGFTVWLNFCVALMGRTVCMTLRGAPRPVPGKHFNLAGSNWCKTAAAAGRLAIVIDHDIHATDFDDFLLGQVFQHPACHFP